MNKAPLTQRPFAGALRHLAGSPADTRRLPLRPNPQPRRTQKRPSVPQGPTPQMAFDRIWTHFVLERKPGGMNENGFSNYRGEGGLRCAIGLLLPDDLYDVWMEGCPIMQVVKRYPDVWRYFSRIPPKLLSALQGAHSDAAIRWAQDGTDFHAEIERSLLKISRQFGLSIPRTVPV